MSEEEIIQDKYEETIFNYLANNCSEFDDEHIKHLVDLKVEQYQNLKKELQQKEAELEKIIGIRECQLEEMQQQKTDYTQVNILEMKLDKLHSIIKELRELLKRYQNNEYYYKYDGKYLKSEIKEDILEILDKENK